MFGRFERDTAGILQLISFLAFGTSDVMECFGTTPLLLLFKGAILVALLQGRKALNVKHELRG